MDEYRSNKLVVMYRAETRSVWILIATNLHLLYGIRYDILVDLCEHAHVNFSLISLLDHFWNCKRTVQKKIFRLPEMFSLPFRVTEKRVMIA